MTDSIDFAHLSDLHLPLAMPRGMQWLGKRGLSGLNWLKKRRRLHSETVAKTLRADILAAQPDLVAITGDIINFGTDQEFEKALPWIESFGPPEKVIIMPGNHEAMARGWKQSMNKHWNAYAQNGSLTQPTMRQVGPVAFLSLSTAISTPPFFASGRIDPQQFKQIETLLCQARDAGLCPVVLMHHPATKITSRRRGLINHEAVCAALAEGGAALVLHGHTHRAEFSWIDAPHGRIPVLGIPSFSIPDVSGHQAGCWRMMRITASSSGWTANITERAIKSDGSIKARTPVIIKLAAWNKKVSCSKTASR